MASKIDKKDQKKKTFEHVFEKNKAFLPAILNKFPFKTYSGVIDTFPVRLTKFKDEIIVERLKIFKNRLFKYDKFSKEAYFFNFPKKMIRYVEKSIDKSENHKELAVYDFKEKEQIVYKNINYNPKFGFMFNYFSKGGAKRINTLMDKYSKNYSKIQEMIDFDLNLLI